MGRWRIRRWRKKISLYIIAKRLNGWEKYEYFDKFLILVMEMRLFF